MQIYPKLSKIDMGEEMKKVLARSEGVELQFFDENGITSEFNFEDSIRRYKKDFPNLKEIIVHPPLINYNIEMIVMKDKKIIEKQLEKMTKLSQELGIDLTLLYHTYWTKDQFISTHLVDTLKDLLALIKNTRVTMLIENLFMMLDEKRECSALEICKYIDNPKLRVCIDTTHLHCKANIYKRNFEEIINEELRREDCEKYVKQIHFASALNNDGYIKKKETHGRKHENIDSVRAELKWLKEHGMLEKNYIIEVAEEDYYSRKDQLEEIKMIKDVLKEGTI